MGWECNLKAIKESESSTLVTDGVRLSGRREDSSEAWSGDRRSSRSREITFVFPMQRVLRHTVCVGVS